MASEFVASLRHRTRHGRMDPSRARYRELLRMDTRRDLDSPAVPGYPPGRDPRLYRCGRNEPLARVATLGIRVLQQGGNISERRVAFLPREFLRERPRLPLLPFIQPTYHGVPRQRKTDPRARMCYFLNFGYNHGRDCYRLLDAETERVAYSRDVT